MTRNRILWVCAALAAAGCATTPEQPLEDRHRDALAEALSATETSVQTSSRYTPETGRQTQISEAEVPSPAAGGAGFPGNTGSVRLSGGPIPAAFDSAPIPAFINAVFAESLGLTVIIDDDVANLREMVTLRTGEALPPRELFNVAAATLNAYGVRVVAQDADTVRFVTDQTFSATAPLFIRGRSSPDTPADLRPVFQYYPSQALSSSDLAQLVNGMTSSRVIVQQSPDNAALLVFGPSDDVANVIYLLRQLDRPRFAGRRSLRIEPAFLTPSGMAESLEDLLSAEGYEVGVGGNTAPIMIAPLGQAGAVYVLAEDDRALRHVADLARELDTPARAGDERSAFIYYVRNTNAESLAQIAQAVVQTDGSGPGAVVDPGATGNGEDAGGALGSSGVVVDEARNAIVYVGRPDQYGALLPILQELDRAPGEVLVEALIVEVTLDDTSDFGISFLTGNIDLGDGFTGRGGTQGGIGLGSGGLLFRVFDDDGDVRAALNAFADEERISIRSNPRVLARSGGEATIEVGTEVPILSQQLSDGSTGGADGILSSVEYRKTGVLLSVSPTVRSDDRIDVVLSQEVSEAQSNNVSDISSPIILNRTIDTDLSLRDGQTILLGGLISENNSSLVSGVPGLMNLPGVGNLFRNQNVGASRTELLIFLTLYLVNTPGRADAMTAFFEREMDTWPDVSGELRFH